MRASNQTDFTNRGVRCSKHGHVHTVVFLYNEPYEYTASRYGCSLCWREAGDPRRVSRDFRNGEPETWPAPGPIREETRPTPPPAPSAAMGCPEELPW